MEPRIGTLTIKQFRAFGELRMQGLGQVNLFTGRNNTGKSSILEAISILASDASPSVLYNILRFREEDADETEESARSLDAEGVFQLSSLFHGFPRFSTDIEPIVVTSDGGARSMRVSIKACWLSEDREAEGFRKFRPRQADLFAEGEPLAGLSIEAGGQRRDMPLGILRRYGYRSRTYRAELGDEPNLPCVSVSPYGGERTATLGPLWDKIALSNRERDVVEALRIIDPAIQAVSMVGGEGPRQTRTAIVRTASIARPVPLRSFGDGLNRLFGIVLSLVNSRNGLLLIDEFENGMHHAVQADAWRVIFRLARKLNVQVFATSHSWDAITAFQKAAAEVSQEGVLVRLSRRKDGDIVPTAFREDELAIVARDRIEVR